MTEFDPLVLPEIAAWDSVESYVTETVSIEAAISLASIITPRLVVARGCLLRETAYDPENLDHWWSALDGNIEAIERMINHLHLWDVFDAKTDAEHEALDALAITIANGWRQAAATAWPDRECTIHITDDYGPTISLSSAE